MVYPLYINRVGERVSSGALRVNHQNESRLTRSFNNPSHIKHIVLIRYNANPLWWIRSEFIKLLHKPTEHSWRNGLLPDKWNISTSGYLIGYFDATYHDDEAEPRRRRGVGGGSVG